MCTSTTEAAFLYLLGRLVITLFTCLIVLKHLCQFYFYHNVSITTGMLYIVVNPDWLFCCSTRG